MGSRRLLLMPMMLLVLSGCGRQDRLVPVAPGAQEEMETVEWGALEDLAPPIAWSSRSLSVSAWSADDVVFGVDNGVVVRITGDQYRRIDIPQQNRVYGLDCREDGSLIAMEQTGGFYIHDGTGWRTWVRVPGLYYRGMEPDGEGGYWAYGGNGTLRHGDDTYWERVDLPDSLDVDDCWIAPDGTAWCVTEELDVIRAVGTDFTVETLVHPPPRNSYKFIEGSPDGRLAVGGSGETDLYLYDGQDWTRVDTGMNDPTPLSDLFWEDGVLHALTYYDSEFVTLEEGEWVGSAPMPDLLGGMQPSIASPLEGGRVYGLPRGGVVVYSDGTVSQVGARIYPLVAAAQLDDRMYVVSEQGSLLAQGDGCWESVLDGIDSGPGILQGGMIAVPPDGLLLLGRSRSFLWREGQSLEILSEAESSREVFRQSESEVYLRTYRMLSRLDGATEAEVHEFVGDADVVDICRGEENELWLLASTWLGRIRDEHEEIELTLEGWSPRGLMYDPQRGMAAFGNARVLLCDGDDRQDVSPWRVTAGKWSRVSVYDMCLDSEDGWIAASRDQSRLMRRIDDRWCILKLDLPISGKTFNQGVYLDPQPGGDVLVSSPTMLVRLVPGGGR